MRLVSRNTIMRLLLSLPRIKIYLYIYYVYLSSFNSLQFICSWSQLYWFDLHLDISMRKLPEKYTLIFFLFLKFN